MTTKASCGDGYHEHSYRTSYVCPMINPTTVHLDLPITQICVVVHTAFTLTRIWEVERDTLHNV